MMFPRRGAGRPRSLGKDSTAEAQDETFVSRESRR